ncbi:hypothetical protein DRE_01315 [Drechslerella stenobrocha 248]|uniref:Uncharacterized protein n=1 Tax=Drechslerella stenobrocha 248 TaxID=1043628 RepID=W7HVR6_9PEZI|nr:hypothetical protein DRE_01315 [Drechslerella stenobrocha 248]
MPSQKIPSVPRMRVAPRHASPVSSTIDPHFFGSDATVKPTVSSSAAAVSAATAPATAQTTPSLKTPVPAKPQYLSLTMSEATPTLIPPGAPRGGDSSSYHGIFGWGAPAEIAFFVSLAVLGICLPLCLFFLLRHRRRQGRKAANGANRRASDLDGTLFDSPPTSTSTTRPPTASSWLEMIKHRTETPAPPHANDGSKHSDEEETYYEPPKPVSFARRKFGARRSGRLSEAEIEREVRELDEEVRRRSRATRSRGQSVGVLPDVDDSCSECAMSYTHDERGHTQPVEGRRVTPIPFLKGVAESQDDAEKVGDERDEKDDDEISGVEKKVEKDTCSDVVAEGTKYKPEG